MLLRDDRHVLTRRHSAKHARGLTIPLWAALAATACGGVDHGGAVTTHATSDDGGTCAPITVSGTRYLRQLSFDLRGRPPTADELQQVAAGTSTPESFVDAMLGSNEFLDRVETWHAARLWPNLDGFRIRVQPVIAVRDGAMLNANREIDYNGHASPDPLLRPSFAAHPTDPYNTQFLPGTVVFNTDVGDYQLRGGSGVIGCDTALAYPDPAGNPQYTSASGDSHRYYDTQGVPLPYYDNTHCPNYCVVRSAVAIPAGSNGMGADDVFRLANRDLTSADFQAMDQGASSASAGSHELDPTSCTGGHCACPSSHLRVINPCDNRSYNGADRSYRVRRDGYRMMAHYWSEGQAIKTCSYEAQTRTTSAISGASCAGRQVDDPSCGCGPNGVYCMPAIAAYSSTPSLAEYRLRRALNEEPLRIVRDVIKNDESYLEIFRTRRGFVNGPLSLFYREQYDGANGIDMGTPAPHDQIPAVPYDPATITPDQSSFDDYDNSAWSTYVRGPEHVGVLTTAAYLGRFPTWRSRISQFRSAFMCRPFTPATNNFPPPTDSCNREPNIARRCGCQNCHAALEPMGAWFGRWAERSTRYLAPTEFPSFDPNCQSCALVGSWSCDDRCRTYYNVDSIDADGARYFGQLRGYLYRTDAEVSRIAEGPVGLVNAAIESGELQSCTVRTAWTNLLGRPMSDREIREVLPDLTTSFEQNGFNYRALIRAIVTSPAYRRID